MYSYFIYEYVYRPFGVTIATYHAAIMNNGGGYSIYHVMW